MEKRKKNIQKYSKNEEEWIETGTTKYLGATWKTVESSFHTVWQEKLQKCQILNHKALKPLKC